MTRSLCVSALLATALALAGCSSTPKLQTRSYHLEHRETEEALIKGVISDYTGEIGDALVATGSPSVDSVRITSDNTAIVKVTPAAHRAIRNALAQSRKDAKDAAGT